MAIEGFASRFRQWSEPGSDRKYSSRFGEYTKNAVLMWARFPFATVAIEQSFVSARTRSTIVRIRRSEMRSRVRLTVMSTLIRFLHNALAHVRDFGDLFALPRPSPVNLSMPGPPTPAS